MTLNELMAKYAVKKGKCTVWTGAVSKDHPRSWIDGKTVMVRRLLWTEAGNPLTKDFVIRTNCGTKACITLAHFKLIPLSNARREAYVAPYHKDESKPESYLGEKVRSRTFTYLGSTYAPEPWDYARAEARNALAVPSVGVPT